MFNNTRRYYKLALETVEGNPADIDSVLSKDSSLGRTLTIEFPTQNTEKPVFWLNNETPYTLQRALEGPGTNINPKPENRYFQNDPELYEDAPLSFPVPIGTNNADAVGRAQTNPPPRYTYVSMYIAAIGQDFITAIYSQPTFIGIFRLPESMS